MEQTVSEFLKEEYDNAMSAVGSKETITSDLNEAEQALLNTILEYSEQAKGVLTVFITSLVCLVLK